MSLFYRDLIRLLCVIAWILIESAMPSEKLRKKYGPEIDKIRQDWERRVQ